MFQFANGEVAMVDQMVVLANDSTGEQCGAGTLLAFDTRTADYVFALVRWDNDNKVERVLLEDLTLALVTESDGFDLYEAELQDYN